MARGVQRTPEEKLQVIDDQIQEMEDRRGKIQVKINELKSQRQAIENEIKVAQLEEVAKVIETSGKTADEILEILKNHQ